MKRFFTLSLFLLTTTFAFCQAPGIRWQQILGGESYDEYHSLVRTIDNGVITVGSTMSATGKFSDNHGDYDVWIEKVNNEGISQWSRVLGGTLLDQPVSSSYNPDGSLVVLCTSLSTDGDITNSHGGNEIWIFKISADGDLLWQKSFGGSMDDYPGKIIRSVEGGYIVSAMAISNDGDLANNNLYYDDWIFMISENGDLLWQKTMGGTPSLNPFGFGPGADEWVNTFTQSPDGSIYLLTENVSGTPDATGNHGSSDIWLIKFEGSGVLQWQKSIGGSKSDAAYCVKIAPSGNIYVGGWGQSTDIPNYHNDDDIFLGIVSPDGDLLFQKYWGGTGRDQIFEIVSIDPDGSCVISATVESGDGDIIGAHYTQHLGDLWVFKVSVTGQILWQKTLGGFGVEEFWGEHTVLNGQGPNFATAIGGVIKTQDGGFLVTSYTESDDGDIIGFHEPGPGDPVGPADILVAKLSASGSLEWQRVLGGSKSEVPRCPALEIGSNNYIIAGVANSINGDIQTNNGIWDGWLINVGAVNRIKGTVFIDQNGNGKKDAEDSLYSDAVVNADNPLHPEMTVPYKGNFIIETDTGTYNVSLQSSRPYYTITPSLHTSTFSTYFNTDSFSFALQPAPGQQDLMINILPLTPARLGFGVSYLITYKNAGTVSIPSGQIIFVKDSRLSLISADPIVSSINGDTLKWNYSSLDPLNERSINLKLQILDPPIVNLNDTISSLAIITPVAGDLTPNDDTVVLRQRVQGSFDPNDKSENLGGSITKEQVTAGEYINYFIRFQNTGTDTAFNVVVRDTLDNKLDWSSFQMITSSHPYTLQIDDQNKLIWTFYGINLPDSNVNEPASHGYIAYRIKADNSLNIGATFLNRASIYFDFNFPVHTNFAPMIVGTPIPLPLKLLDFDARYQQPDAALNWTTADESNVDRFIIERGDDPYHFAPVGTVAAKGGNMLTHYQFNDKLASTSGDKFYYRLKMMDLDQKFTYSNIEQVSRQGKAVNELVINPNPVKGSIAHAWINFERAATVELGVVDLQGRYRMVGKQAIGKGFNVVPVDLSGLSNGAYILQAKVDGKFMVSRFVLTR